MATTELAFNTTKELKDQSSPKEEDVQFETSVQDGRNVTVVRDSEGKLLYPSYVPPQTRDLKGKLGASGERSQQPPLPGSLPRQSRSDPLGEPETSRKGQEKRQPRPLWADKRSASEASPKQGIRRFSTLPTTLRRAGTNASGLQRAAHDDWSSSSSSSSSEDEGPAPKALNKQGPKKRPSDDRYRRFRVGNENYRTKGKVSKRDGRLAISVNDTSSTGYLAKAIGSAVKKVVPLGTTDEGDEDEAAAVDAGKEKFRAKESAIAAAALENTPCPRLNIVIMVIGSRGDAQPFLRIGQILKGQYGHRVRIATHPAFREFVEDDCGLEFFSVGGDPSELMAFMVKNPGMIPTLETMRAGDIGRRRAAMAEMFEGFWRACIDTTDDRRDAQNLRLMGPKDPFVADAIIANPPSFAHYHIAEALGVPLHLMFTFPYTPTTQFPHPLASIKKTNVDPGYANFISYPLVEMMVWQGLGDLINDFRVKTLGLDPVSTLWAPGATYRLHVPFTYLWSPGLVPKPEDWGDEVDISGFVFLDLASSFKPPADLVKFLDDGDQPIYIGFGSIVVDDADRFTEMIFDAVKLAGVRALVSKGWGGLGNENVPDNIYMLENTPHDWLFPRVSACVIHGGAGTTAIALKCGKPTMVVPFFGDQHFWGSMLERCGAGPEPVPYKKLTAEKLAEGIKYCLGEEARGKAAELAKDIDKEGDGAANACRSFHKHLTLRGSHSMRCSILEDQVAVWHVKHTSLRLSAVAADVVVGRGFLPWRKLKLLRHREWNDFEGPGEPFTGLAGSVLASVSEVLGGVGGVPYRLAKSARERKERKERRKKRHEARHEARLEAKKRQAEAKQAKNNGSTSQDGENGRTEANGTPQPEARIDSQDHASTDTKEGKDSNKTNDNNGQGKDRGQQSGPNDDTASMLTADTVGEEEHTRRGDFVSGVGKGVGKSVHALVRAPVDLSVAVAQGFHNAPRLYGDDSVRRPLRVTGFRSGLRAGRLEFGLGVYDGWTGVVRLPIRGARDGGGVRGFAKGVGMGLMGFVLKDLGALAGLFAYPLKGLTKELEKGRTPVLRHIRRARIVQAQRELGSLDERERAALEHRVIEGWDVLRELAREIDAAEKRKRKGGIGLGRLRSKISVRRRRGLGEAFESVETARKALDVVRRGEIETLVEVGVRSREGGKRKAERKANVERKKEAAEHAGEKRRENQERKSRDQDRPNNSIADAVPRESLGTRDEEGHQPPIMTTEKKSRDDADRPGTQAGNGRYKGLKRPSSTPELNGSAEKTATIP